MSIRLFRSCSVPFMISTQELHVYNTRHLHEDNYKERYVDAMYRLQERNLKE